MILKPRYRSKINKTDTEKCKSPNSSTTTLKSLPLCIFRSALSCLTLENLVNLLKYYIDDQSPELILLLKSDWSVNSRRLLRVLSGNRIAINSNISNTNNELASRLIELSSNAYLHIDHDCVHIRSQVIKQLCRQEYLNDFKAFELLCSFGSLDADLEVRLQAVQAIANFQNFAHVAIITLNRKDYSSSISGIFVCALEDECMHIRRNAIKTMEVFALKNEQFAQVAVDHMADMLNDEIEEVRIQAIHSMKNLLSQPNFSGNICVTDFADLLSSLEDCSMAVRSAFRGILRVITINSLATMRSIINDGLIRNLNRYPEDKILIWECASELGRHHEQLAVLLHGELLGARTYMTITEPDVEDPFYMTLLLFIINGLFSSDATYQSPYKIPFLAKHIQAIRVLDRNLLPSPIRSSLADEHQTDRQNYYRQILEETLDLCKIADESQSYEKLMNCAQTLKSFEDTSLHDVARFYKQQAELRAYAYQKAYHFKYFKDIAYKLLASFENIDGIPNLILLIKSILQANKKLPPFIFLPCEQSNICERQILHVELSAKEFKFAAGLVCPIGLRVKLKCKTRVDLYAQVALPNGRIRIYYLHSQSGPVSDGMYHLFTSQILISAKRSWTAAATVRIQLGCLLDKTLAAHFDGNNDCSKLSRFVPMYNWIACNIHPINIMF